MLRGIATLVALPLMLSACGGSISETERARSVVQRYRAALAAHNGPEVCSLLSTQAKHELANLGKSLPAHGGKAFGCLSFARRLDELPIDAKASARIREAKIGTAKVVGDKATVLVRELGEGARRLAVIKTPAGWKISLPPLATSPTFDLRGEPAISVEPPPTVAHSGGETLPQFNLGRTVAAQSGCLACHRIGQAGNNGPGPDLTHVGSKLPPTGIERAITNPTAPMPSFRNLPKAKLKALVTFLSLAS